MKAPSARSSFHRVILLLSALSFAVLAAIASGACGGGGGGAAPGGESDAGADVGSMGSTGPSEDATAPSEDVNAPPVGNDATPPPTGSDDTGAPPPVDLAPAPALTSVAPTQAIVGTAGPTITCLGTGFVARSVIQVNGVPLATTYGSATELEATIPKSDMSVVGTLQVTVGTAPPGGGGSNEVDFQIVNPLPTLTALSPASAVLGSADTLLTVTGASFVTGATIAFDGTALPTTVTSATTATATIPAASLATSGQYPITVTNPAPGGGVSSSIAFIVSNPSVAITSVTPATITIGSPDTPLTIAGTGFVAASVVSFNAKSLATTYVSATQLSATVAAASLATAGKFPVAVTNPPPGGGVSSPFTVSVTYPVPVATSLSPSSALLGASPPTITVTGSGFIAGATTIALDGVASATTVVDATHVQTTMTTTEMAAAHSFKVTVSNPTPGGGTSAALSFSVNDPIPVATSVSPSSVLVGAGDTTITIKGSGFVPASTILVGATPLTTTYVSATSLTATLPAADLAVTGTLSLYVTSPAPGGGTSSPALTFGVNDPLPVATAVSPSFALVGAPDTSITITGSGFVAASTVLLGSAPLATTFQSATSLRAVIPAADLAAAATLSLSVTTPAPGGGVSASLGFTVDNPGPTITALSPSSVLVPAGDTTVTVSGTGFVNGASVVQVGGTPFATTYAGGTLQVTIPAAQLATAGTFSLTVVNPAPGGGTSNVAYFTANDPAPVVTAVSPTSIYAGSAATAITLTGSGFVAASVVQVNGGAVPITAQSATSLTATVPAALLATPTTLSVTVVNPAPGGGTSAVVTIGVVCNVSAASVVLSALNTPTTLSLSYTSAPQAYRITETESNYQCPSSDDTRAKEPYLTYVVVNDTAQSATLSSWAVCSSNDDAFLTYYKGSTVPTTQSQLEACSDYVAEGKEGAGGLTSPSAGGSEFCPGLTKANGGGMTLAACATAVVLIQPYASGDPSYTPPTTLTIELQ